MLSSNVWWSVTVHYNYGKVSGGDWEPLRMAELQSSLLRCWFGIFVGASSVASMNKPFLPCRSVFHRGRVFYLLLEMLEVSLGWVEVRRAVHILVSREKKKIEVLRFSTRALMAHHLFTEILCSYSHLGMLPLRLESCSTSPEGKSSIQVGVGQGSH